MGFGLGVEIAENERKWDEGGRLFARNQETLVTAHPRFLQRARKRLKIKGMCFALLHGSAKEAKERGVRGVGRRS